MITPEQKAAIAEILTAAKYGDPMTNWIYTRQPSLREEIGMSQKEWLELIDRSNEAIYARYAEIDAMIEAVKNS